MTYNTINDDKTIAGNGEGTILAGRYRIVRQLGAGGMGSVWLAEDTQLDNKQFAIKMLPAILVANKRAYRQLKDEALVAMRLVHPNIVQIRAFEENNGNPFLVMDYIDGQTLDDYLADKGKLSEDEVIRVLRPIAAALDYAHSEGVVHRDVKPANVMIRKDGHPFILDFGIAREIQETMTRVTGKLSSGTLLYMSPEQLMGEQPKSAQDIYSFAAMAYECLKGEPPFSHGQIEFQIMNKEPEPLPGGPRPVAVAIMAGLAKKPEDRPATCAAVLEGDKIVSRRGAEAQRNLNGCAESVGRGAPAAPHGRAGSPPPAENGRARSPSGLQPQGGVVASGSEKINVPKSDWPYLPPNMRPHPDGGAARGAPTAPHGRAGSPLPAEIGRARSPSGPQPQGGVVAAGRDKISVPKSDWPYLPPDMRPHPGGGVGRNVLTAPKTTSGFSCAERVESVGRGTPATPPQGNVFGGVLKVFLAISVFAFCMLVTGALMLRSELTGCESSGEHISLPYKEVTQGQILWEGGPRWADMNIGAEKPWEYGYYFWWGDTVGYKRVGDAWVASDGSVSNFSFCEANTPTYGKSYGALKSEGWITEEGALTPSHDAAYAHWGVNWRMPTKQELEDLNNKCDWKWTTMNGVNGYEVRGKGGYASASIFLPCAGWGGGTSLNTAGSYGNYWSSVLCLDYYVSWYRYFYSAGHGTGRTTRRYDGQSVRPVQGATK